MSKLSEILTRKRNEAIMNPNKRTTPVTLPGGLKIQIERNFTQVTFFLSREGDQPPSAQEIQTLLQHYPTQTHEIFDRVSVVVFKVLEG